MELWVIVALVVLAVAIVGAGAYWYYRQHTPALLDTGATITPQSVLVGDETGTGQYFPEDYFPNIYFPIYGTAPSVVESSISHIYLYAQRRRRR